MDAVSSSRASSAGSGFRWRVTSARLALLMIAGAIALRLIGIGSRPLWLDEAYSAWFSARSWTVLWTEVPTYEPHPPFYYSLLKLWRAAAGGDAVALRLFSVLLAAATVPLVIAAANALERLQPTGRPHLRAGIAAFFVACSPMLVMLGQEARPYPLLVFAYALAVLGLLRLIEEFRRGEAGRGASWLMLAGGTELGLWAHGLGALYALCLAAALAPAWLNGIGRDRLLRGMAAAAAVTLGYLPCLLMIAGRAGDWGSGWLRFEPSMILQLLSVYLVPVEVLTIGSAVAALVTILLINRALQQGIGGSGWRAERALLLLWWGPPLLAIVVSLAAIPIFLPRTLAPTLVPAALAIGGALARIGSERERFLLSAALVITLVPSSVQMALRPAPEAWDEVATYLDTHVRAGDAVWLYPNDSAVPLGEAGARVRTRGIPGDYPAVGIPGPVRAGSPAVVSLTDDQAVALARSPVTEQPRTIWLVTRQRGLFDPQDALPRALGRVRHAGRAQTWGYIEVQPFTR